MLGRSSRFAAIAALALGAIGGIGGTPAVTTGPTVVDADGGLGFRSAIQKFGAPSFAEVIHSLAPISGQRGGSPGKWNYPKPGFSVRQGQRLARKRRNVARNRRAHRA